MTTINQLLSSLVGSLSASCCASREVTHPKSSVGLRSAELYVLNKGDSFLENDKANLPFSADSPRPGEFVGRLIHVDINGSYQFRSIQQAIDNADHGDRIFVHGGHYFERIQITKQLELVGVGPVESVVIEPKNGDARFDGGYDELDDAVIAMEAANSRLRNLSFSRKDGSGVIIENKCGDLIVEGCHISGGATGIRVSNSASVVARYCDITGCTAHGVMSCSSGWISLEKCCVSDCFHGAFSSDLGTQCSIKDCDVLSSSQVGLVLHDEAQVMRCALQLSGLYLMSAAHTGARGKLAFSVQLGCGGVPELTGQRDDHSQVGIACDTGADDDFLTDPYSHCVNTASAPLV